MTEKEFRDKVRAMRIWQSRYFKLAKGTAKDEALRTAKALEAEVDKELSNDTAPKLF